MQTEFEMSMIGKLTHFLGLQIRQQDSGIFLSQSKYEKNLVKKFGLESTSSVRTPMNPNVKLTVDLLVFFTLLLVDLTLVTVLECVLNIRLIPRSPT